jgi:hypothetical protein
VAGRAAGLIRRGRLRGRRAHSGIFQIDGTAGPLPELLGDEELARLSDLRSAALVPKYKIESQVSPDDGTVLVSAHGDRFFLDLRTGATVPVNQEQLILPLANFIWLDDDTVGFLTSRMNQDNTVAVLGAGIDRHTGEVDWEEPRLAKTAALIAQTDVPILLSEDGRKLLLADNQEAKPPAVFSGGMNGAAAGTFGYDAVPGTASLVLAEGSKLEVVDVDSGVPHHVFTMGPDIKIQDVSFSPDGSKFSLTSFSLGDSMDRMFDGANMTEDEYKDSVGALAPGDNIFF